MHDEPSTRVTLVVHPIHSFTQNQTAAENRTENLNVAIARLQSTKYLNEKQEACSKSAPSTHQAYLEQQFVHDRYAHAHGGHSKQSWRNTPQWKRRQQDIFSRLQRLPLK